MRDNQNRDLEAAKRHQATEAANHSAGRARMEQAIQTTTFATWQIVEDIEVLRVADSKFVAQPITGRRNARRFDIIDIEAREFVCQVNGSKVHNWLIQANL